MSQQSFEFHALVEQSQKELPKLFGTLINPKESPQPPLEQVYDVKEEEVILTEEYEVDDEEEMEEILSGIAEEVQDSSSQTRPVRPTKVKSKDSGKSRNERGNEMDATILSFIELKCELCDDLSFTLFPELISHYRSEHDAEGFFDCCGQRFTRRYKLYNHIMGHLKMGHLCDQCPKKFASRSGLELHKESHLSDDQKPFECKVCAKRFFRENKLRLHMSKAHVPEDERPFKCPDCGKGFVNNSILVDHCRKIHENLRPFICEVCGSSFKTKHILNDHIQTHFDRPRVKCDECGKFYRNELQVKRHQKRSHGIAGQVFQCKVCGVQAKNSYALAAHINRNHKTDPQKYQCEVCSKGFKRTKTLREHMASHTGEKLYRCAFCEREFNSSANKYKHQKNRHPEEYGQMKEARDLKMFQSDDK